MESIISILGILLILLLICIICVRFVESVFRNDKYLNFYRILTIAVGLNVMIFAFIIMSYSKIKFVPGPIGPQGNRGKKGPSGFSSMYNVCNNRVLNAGEKKYKILKKENSVAQYPSLVELADDEIVF